MTARMLVGLGIAVVAIIGASATHAESAPSLQLPPVLSGLSGPILLTNAGDGSDRLFVVEQRGVIKVLQPGQTTPTVFLDIMSKVRAGGEQGLLGLAFHPQFASNRRFFVHYSRQADGFGVIAEYHVSPGDPNVGDPSTEVVFLVVSQPFGNHNGGMIAFGPDGFLYIAKGDGGGGGDPNNLAQNLNSLNGKILRIDVDTPNGAQPYSSPASNPFFGAITGADEIFAYGLRNPWRFSFDRETGDLYVGDVGQGAIEEIDIVVNGGNYGWRVWEGSSCTGLGPAACNIALVVFPIAQYGHTGGRCSVTGGYVYRGAMSSLPVGSYVYADYCSGEIFLYQSGTSTLAFDTALNISSFGEDESGELYVVALGGTVHRLIAGPVVSSVTPANGPPGATVPVTIAGSGFVSGATASVGAGITVMNVSVVSASELTATLVLGAAAVPGARAVVVTNPNGGSATLAGGFTVLGETTPPDTTITAGPSGSIAVSDASFTWTGSDNLTPVGSLVYAFRLHPLEATFSAFGSATSKSYSALPNGAYTFFVKARDLVGHEDPTPASQGFTVAVPLPSITSPTPGTTLTSTTVTFTGGHTSGDTQHWLFVGTTPGTSDLVNRDLGTGHATTVSGLPASGTIYVTYWTYFAAFGWVPSSQQYTMSAGGTFNYTLANGGSIAVTRGASGSSTVTATLQAGASQAVSFAASGLPSGATASFTSPGACSPTCSTTLTIATMTSTPTGTFGVTVTGTPLGRTTTLSLVVNAPVPPPITSPAPGSTLTSTTVTFTGGHASGDGQHWLFVGTTSGASDLVNRDLGSGHATTVSGLPTSGTIYVSYWTYFVGTGWQSTSQQYTMSAGGTFNYTLANSGGITVTRGASGGSTVTATLQAGASQAVSFAASGLPGGATASFTSPGACSPTCSTTLTIATMTSTPTGTFGVTVTGTPLGRTTTLSLVVNAPVASPITSPAPGSTLTSTTVMFTGGHTSGDGQHWLFVGTTSGASDLLNRDLGSGHATTVSGLPTSGTIYVSYWTYFAGIGWVPTSQQYTMSAAP